MPPLPLRSSRSVLAVKSWLSNLHHFCLLSAFVMGSMLPALAAAPPTGENAYCGKGNIAQFGAKDGVALLEAADLDQFQLYHPNLFHSKLKRK